MGIFPSQGHTMFHLHLRENDTPRSWEYSLHRGTQHYISITQRNYTPISWAHPTHGLSLRPTHSVCVLEDVSSRCNHQHSLSDREAFSTRTSLSQNYLKFVLDVIINTPSQLGRYSPPGQVSHKSTLTSFWKVVW
jgi:hypothetical protein